MQKETVPMPIYKLANGYVLSDMEIEECVKQWEDGSWEGELITLRSGEDGSADTRKCTYLRGNCPKNSDSSSQ